MPANPSSVVSPYRPPGGEERKLCTARPLRGRPRSAEKTAAVLDAASELFLTQGYEGTSMDEVARCAGVSKQTVYSHFSSKEQLFSAAVRARLEQASPEQALDKLEVHTLEADLLAVARAYAHLTLSEEAMAMYRLLVAEAGRSDALAHLFWQSGPEDLLQRLSAFLETWRARGELDFTNAERAAFDLTSLIKGALHFKRSIGLVPPLDTADIDHHAEACVETFLRMYRVR